jgi:hypothetical protein
VEGVVIDTLGFANRALVVLLGIGTVVALLVCLWLEGRWRELTRKQRWDDPWADWAFPSQERFARLERERQVA